MQNCLSDGDRCTLVSPRAKRAGPYIYIAKLTFGLTLSSCLYFQVLFVICFTKLSSQVWKCALRSRWQLTTVCFRKSIRVEGASSRKTLRLLHCRGLCLTLGRVRSIVISKLTVFSAPAGWKYHKFYRVLRYKLDLSWSLRYLFYLKIFSIGHPLARRIELGPLFSASFFLFCLFFIFG